MADKQESALTQQSDCKWVRALDANGNSIRISKEDLAAVVGGLLENRLMQYQLYNIDAYSEVETDITSTSVIIIRSTGSNNVAIFLVAYNFITLVNSTDSKNIGVEDSVIRIQVKSNGEGKAVFVNKTSVNIEIVVHIIK